MAEEEFKFLAELRVTELKSELDKRGLDKNGIKIILTDRLEKALKAEGHDPSTYKFYVSESGTPLTSPLKNKEDSVQPTKPEDESMTSVDAVGDESKASENENSNADENMDEVQNQLDEPTSVANEESGRTNNREEEQLEDPLNEPASDHVTQTTATKGEHAQISDPDRMFWVRGLNSATKAADLRELFSQHGKVVRAKIFTSKKTPGKTFGLVTVVDADVVEKCYVAQDNKPWNGCVISIEKGNISNMSSKATAAASALAARKELAKSSATTDRKPDTTKEEKQPSEEGKSSDKKRTEDGKEREKEREKRDADHVKDGSSRREPIREPRDSRKTITAARRPIASRPYHRPTPITSRLSRPTRHHTPPPRRGDNYGRHDDRDRLRAREEELRRRAADLELEREKERLRAEREKIEREKLELQLQKQKAQLAAYEKAALGTSSRHRSDISRPSASGRRDDKYAPRSSSGDMHRSHERPRERERIVRVDDRRPPRIDERSRSRHDSHRETAVQRDPRFVEPRRENRHEAAAPRATGTNYAAGRTFPREVPASSNGQNYYGTRTSYSAGINAAGSRDYEHGARVAPVPGSWSGNGGNWSGIASDNSYGMRPPAATSWNSYGTGADRMDYEKYRRTRQF